MEELSKTAKVTKNQCQKLIEENDKLKNQLSK